MRQVEHWLDATGWGASWPSFDHRNPEPAPTQQGNANDHSAGNPATIQGCIGNGKDGGGSSGAGNAEESEDDKDNEGGSPQRPDEDGEGKDLEQPAEEDETLDEEGDRSDVADSYINPGEGEDEDTEAFPSGFISL